MKVITEMSKARFVRGTVKKGILRIFLLGYFRGNNC